MVVPIGALVSFLAFGCKAETPAAPAAESPVPQLSALVTGNPYNSLSSLISFTAEQGESARVVSLASEAVDSTPYVRVTGGPDTIAVLGLRPATLYRQVLEVSGPTGLTRSDTLSFTTGSLPEALRRVTVTPTGLAGPGLTLTSLALADTLFAIAFDAEGEIRWYRRFAGAGGGRGDIKQQRNGHFTVYRGGSSGVEEVAGHYVEFTPAGDSLRAITVAPPRYLDNHELWITGPAGDERFHCFTYERRTVDLSAIGGATATALSGHQLVRLRPDGSPELEWNAWDQVPLADWIERPGPNPLDPSERDFDHPNSLDFDRDGNYIVSFRRLEQIIKIDAATGAVLWRLGGRRNQFTFRNDPLNGFSAQHSVRVLPNGNLLLYDNGTRHPQPESRAVEYALDTVAMTATMVWEFRHLPPIYTPGLGLVQRLSDGSTFIAYGQQGRTTEVGPDGTVRGEVDIRVDGRRAVLYRLSRIASLYRTVPP